MTKIKLTKNAKEIIKRVKEKETRKSYNFRFPKDLMDSLDRSCKKQDVTKTEVIEELIKDFLGAK